MAGPFPCTREGRTADEERPFVRVDRKESEVGSFFFHHAPEVVDVYVGDPTCVGSVGSDGMEE